MKFIDFLKPDLKRIIVLLIFLTPTILYFISSIFRIYYLPVPLSASVFPVEFELLNKLINTYFIIGFFPFMFVASLTSGNEFVFLFLILFVILFWYLITCIILFSWNRIFDYFGCKKKKYEKFAVLSLIILFIFIPLILGAIIIIENKTRPNISIEINTRPNISRDDFYKYVIPTFGDESPPFKVEELTKLQELSIHNYFLSRVRYRLPDVTACIYDIEENLKLGLHVSYITEDRQNDAFNYYAMVKPNTKLKVYLLIYGRGEVYPMELFIWNNIPEYDNDLLLESIKQNFGIDWVINARIEKIDEDMGIILTDEKNHISLSLNNERTEVNLAIDDGRTYKLFVVSDPWDKLHIYKLIEKEKFDEILLFNNVGMNNFNYCHNATDAEVLAAEKISISK